MPLSENLHLCPTFLFLHQFKVERIIGLQIKCLTLTNSVCNTQHFSFHRRHIFTLRGVAAVKPEPRHFSHTGHHFLTRHVKLRINLEDIWLLVPRSESSRALSVQCYMQQQHCTQGRFFSLVSKWSLQDLLTVIHSFYKFP